MDDERLEWALRRLPGVLACSLDGDTVTLLLDPHASVLDVEAGANALLLGAGDVRPPLLLGGTRPVLAPSEGRFKVLPVVKAAGPGLVAVGAAALVASLVASPAAFWRDSVTPSAAPSAVGGPATAPRHRDLTDQRAPLGGDSVSGVPDAAAPTAPTVDRRLVLLVPQLPSAPIQNISTVGATVAGVEVPPIATGSSPVKRPALTSPAGAASSDDGQPAKRAEQTSRSGRPRSDSGGKHGGKHGEKDEQGHGEKGWGKTRREQVRSATARAHGRGHHDD